MMLILTEKPSVAKDFANALNCSYSDGVYKNSTTVISNCVGHLFKEEVPAHYGSSFPVIPNHWDYRLPDDAKLALQAKKVTSLLKKHKADSILIATDADREGEIIARECLLQAGIFDYKNIKRFWVSEALTPDVVKHGIENAKPLTDYNRIAAQGFARQHADWLVGMNFCRYLSDMAGTKLTVGRVQTAILSAIEQRCNAIKNFKSEKYFEHYGVFYSTAEKTNSSCRGIYFENEQTGFPDDSKSTKLKSCVGQNAKLTDRKAEKKTQNPPQLYNLNALQKDAFKRYGYTADKTLKIIQTLYEDLKCVSYPRTPSRVMGSSNVELCRKLYNLLSQNDACKEKSDISLNNTRVFNDKKLEAHHALIPLNNLPETASTEQNQIYTLIKSRFLIAFLPPCEYEKQTYILDINCNKFKISGKKIIKRGFKEFVIENKEDESEKSDDELQTLDNIDWENLVLSDIETKEKWTKAPPYFNEASILSFMENPKTAKEPNTQNESTTQKKLAGLGTAATRHTFIPLLLRRGYIEPQKQNYICTKLGYELLEAVRASSLKRLADIDMTTEWEEKLANNPDTYLEEIKNFVRDAVKQKTNIYISASSVKIQCPICKKEIRKGKSNWYCTGYKEGCNFVLWETVAGAKLTEKDVISLCNGKKTGIKHCISKAGKAFDCRFVVDENQIKFVFDEKKQR